MDEYKGIRTWSPAWSPAQLVTLCRALPPTPQDQALQKISGLTQEELEFKLRTLFHIADEDNNGYLTRGEVRKCLESQDLHFTRAQVNVLMAEMEDDHSGRLTYEDFVPLALTLLVEMTEQQLEAEELTEQVRRAHAA